MKCDVSFHIDTEALPHVPDDYLAALWHVAQFNPAPFGTPAASELVLRVGREIITRWLKGVPAPLYVHQESDALRATVMEIAEAQR